MKFTASLSESVRLVASTLPEAARKVSPAEKATVVSVGFQVLLVMAVCGVEICLVFKQIYQVLILQYLGVPLLLVSINGVVGGLCSLLIFPVVGYLTDGGTNPKRRKMASLIVGMNLYQIGIMLIFISGLIKISIVDNLLHTLENNQNLIELLTTVTVNSPGNAEKSDQFNNTSTMNAYFSSTSHRNVNNSDKDNGTTHEAGLSVTGYLAFFGFIFIDIACDVSMSTTRAYILESAPKFQHRKLLVMTTAVQAVSGTSFAFLGVFDISDALGKAFGVDGTAAVLLFFCCLLFIAATGCFLSTIITGYFLTRNHDLAKNELDKNHSTTEPNNSREKPRNSRHSYTKDCHRNLSAESSNEELIPSNCKSKYSTMESSSPLTNCISSATEATNNILENSDQNRHQVGNFSVEDDGPNNELCLSKNACRNNTTSGDKLNSSNFSEYKKLKVSTQSRLNTPNVDRNTNEDTSWKGGKNSEKYFMIKRLAILVTSTFFTIGASISFMYYGANTLTLGIFHGDPTALPGTEGKYSYEKGLRVAALGNLLCYILFTITSILVRRIIDIVGERPLFILFHLLFLIPLLALVLARRIEAYYATVTMAGVFRSALCILPYIMATEITQEKGNSSSSDGSKKTNLGKTMSLIGFLLPAHKIIFQAIIGPVIQASGNVWSPLIYGLVSGCASIVIFLPLFIVK